MHIQHSGLAWAALALGIGAAVSLVLELGIARSMVWAGARAALQLSAISVILSFLFQVQSFILMILAIFAMLCIATHAVKSRLPGACYAGFNIHVFISLGVGAWIFSIFAGAFVLEPGSWRKAEIMLPFVGLLIGNSISGISLGLVQWRQSLQIERERIETRLAHGASSWEAIYPALCQAVSTAMTPILNSMTVAGIVSFPGMMTGQLLAGADPKTATEYQIAALFLISASTLVGVLIALALGYRAVFNSNHQMQVQWFDLNDQVA